MRHHGGGRFGRRIPALERRVYNRLPVAGSLNECHGNDGFAVMFRYKLLLQVRTRHRWTRSKIPEGVGFPFLRGRGVNFYHQGGLPRTFSPAALLIF